MHCVFAISLSYSYIGACMRMRVSVRAGFSCGDFVCSRQAGSEALALLSGVAVTQPCCEHGQGFSVRALVTVGHTPGRILIGGVPVLVIPAVEGMAAQPGFG